MAETHLYEITERLHSIAISRGPAVPMGGHKRPAQRIKIELRLIMGDYPEEQVWAAMIHYGMAFPNRSRALLARLDDLA